MTEYESQKYPTLYKDAACAVINKPVGILVHSLPGHPNKDTIARWWQSQPGVARVGWPDKDRVGIVHRLDRDTTGALLLAKTPQALAELQKQFHDRKVKKQYLALVAGQPPKKTGEIESLVSRQAKKRTKRRASLIDFSKTSAAKKAISRYRALDNFQRGDNEISLVEFEIKTGRTHQIRLHAKMLGTPILGDPDYATKPSRRASEKLGIKRTMLHAEKLSFTSPVSHKKVFITIPLPEDMQGILKRYFNSNLSRARRGTRDDKGKERPEIFVVVGPSGSGKGSVIKGLLADKKLNLGWVKTATTRPRRPDDAKLGQYRYVSQAEFKKLLRAGEILEHNFFNGHYYGTLKEELEKVTSQGKKAILNLDINGAVALKKIFDQRVATIFLDVPINNLKLRLQKRGTSDTVIFQRLNIAKRELARKNQCAYTVVNEQNKLPATIKRIAKIIHST